MNIETMNRSTLKHAAELDVTSDLSIKTLTLALGAAALALVLSAPAHASVIVSGTAGWNLDNVVPGPVVVPPDDGDYESLVYDRDVTGGTAGANTYGKITYGGGESLDPGIKVMNGQDQGGFPTGQGLDPSLNQSNCIMASSYTYCDGPRQSGKRFKQQITGIGPIDLVFNVDNEDPTETEYRAFQRLVNQTGLSLGGFVLELGFGVGDAFSASTAGDGLSLTPRGSQNPTQFPFGLFGEDGDMGRIGGFFDGTERSLFDTVFTEDSITTTGILGAYDDYFGYWLTQADAPIGLLFDNDNDPSTDALVMAFFNGDIGQWERRRFVDENCDVVPEVLDPAVRGTLFGSFGDIDIYENAAAETNCSGTIAGTQIEEAPIEDVANLNVNYFLQVGAADLWPTYNIIDDTATFTIRVTGLIEPTGPGMVPVPATAPLLVAGLGGIAFAFRRRATRRKAA